MAGVLGFIQLINLSSLLNCFCTKLDSCKSMARHGYGAEVQTKEKIANEIMVKKKGGGGIILGSSSQHLIKMGHFFNKF